MSTSTETGLAQPKQDGEPIVLTLPRLGQTLSDSDRQINLVTFTM